MTKADRASRWATFAAGDTIVVRRRAHPVRGAGIIPPAGRTVCTVEWGGQARMSALFDAVERGDLALIQLLVEHGATKDDDAFYHACEQSNTAFLDVLHMPGFEGMVNHKLDFEDAAGLRWFLDRGVDVNAHRCLHHAISRGRGPPIL